MFRDLLQTYGTCGAVIMNEGLLLIIAIVVFSLMAIGLALTVYEFREHVVVDPHNKKQTFRGEKVEHKVTRDRVENV